MPSEWIINATEAYSSRQYQGNLCNILYVPKPKIECANSALASVETARIVSPPKVYIDNQALAGFIDFFKKQDCLSGCAHCNYCQETADKVVQLDHPEVDEYVSVLKSFLNDLTSSGIFLAKKY